MTLSIVALMVAAASPQVGPAPESVEENGSRALLERLTAEPRIVGTRGYERAIAFVEREITSAGWSVERTHVTVDRAIPTHSDLLLFEDSVSTSAFAGLRERWRADGGRAAARPAAFDWNPESADARGPVVDLGAGTPEDFRRVAGLGVPLEGSVVLVALPRLAGARATGVREIATLAAEARAIAVLVAPTATLAGVVNDFVLEDTRWTGSGPLALPTIPIRSLEAETIRERLRAKRVRGADGKGVTVKLGPGPVEARISVECPVVRVEEVPVLTWSRGSRGAGASGIDSALANGLWVPCDESPGDPAAGAARIAAVLEAVARSKENVKGRNASTQVVFGPSSSFRVPEGAGERPVRELTALLWQPPGTGWQPGAPSSIPSVHGESLEQLDRRLGGELRERADAAAAVIAYSLQLRAADSAGLEAALRTLRRPLPTSAPR